MTKAQKQKSTIPCAKCGKPHIPSGGYLGKASKCEECRKPLDGTGRVGRVAIFDRWANGNQYGSFNSDDD